MSKCQRCGLPMFAGAASYSGPQCKCWAFYRPAPDAAEPVPLDGCKPFRPLTEADVRRIVREELARATPPTRTDGATGDSHE